MRATAATTARTRSSPTRVGRELGVQVDAGHRRLRVGAVLVVGVRAERGALEQRGSGLGIVGAATAIATDAMPAAARTAAPAARRRLAASARSPTPATATTRGPLPVPGSRVSSSAAPRGAQRGEQRRDPLEPVGSEQFGPVCALPRRRAARRRRRRRQRGRTVTVSEGTVMTAIVRVRSRHDRAVPAPAVRAIRRRLGWKHARSPLPSTS